MGYRAAWSMHVVMALVCVERLRRGKRLVDWHWRGRLRCTARGGRRCVDRLGSRRGRSRLWIVTAMLVAVFYAGTVITAACPCRVGLSVIVMVLGLSCIRPVAVGPRFRACWCVVAMAQTRCSTHGRRQRDDPDGAE